MYVSRCVRATCACKSQRSPEEGLGSPRTGVTDSCEPTADNQTHPAKAASALKHGAASPAPSNIFLQAPLALNRHQVSHLEP